MDGVILAAGQGKRLRPLTESIPKALIKVGTHTLAEHILLGMASVGVDNVVFVTGFMGSRVENFFARGNQWELATSFAAPLVVGPSRMVANPGDYVAMTLVDVPVIVVRGDDGRLRGFENVCPHQGAPLCLGAHTGWDQIQCNNHQWTWDLAGRLQAVDFGAPVEPGQEVQQCGFAGAGGAHDGVETGLIDGEVDAPERLDGARPERVGLSDLGASDHGGGAALRWWRWRTRAAP